MRSLLLFPLLVLAACGSPVVLPAPAGTDAVFSAPYVLPALPADAAPHLALLWVVPEVEASRPLDPHERTTGPGRSVGTVPAETRFRVGAAVRLDGAGGGVLTLSALPAEDLLAVLPDSGEAHPARGAIAVAAVVDAPFGLVPGTRLGERTVLALASDQAIVYLESAGEQASPVFLDADAVTSGFHVVRVHCEKAARGLEILADPTLVLSPAGRTAGVRTTSCVGL